jgi:hypothetical protein
MTDSNYLPAFSGWLVALGEDVLSLANLLESSDVQPRWRRASAQALESLLRASGLIPEGLESLGYLEQAFVLRLLAQRSLAGGPDASAPDGDVPDREGLARQGVSDVVEVLRAPSGEPSFEELEDPAGEAPVGELDVTGSAPVGELDGATGEARTAELDAASGEAPVGELADAVEEPLACEHGAELEPSDAPGEPGAPVEASGALDAPEVLIPDDAPAAELPEPATFARDEVPGRLARLAADAPLIEAFIGEDLPALHELAFVEARRGRRPQQLLEDAAARDEVLREARAWVEGYRAPELGEGPEELVKLRSFFTTRLRRAS